jgi:hypothetical protein
MARECVAIEVCTDCVLILANGCDCALSAAGTGHWSACHALNMSDSEITVGCGDESCSDCAGESTRFASSRCECCGDTLAGDRHCAVMWWEEPEVPGSHGDSDDDSRTVAIPRDTLHLYSDAANAMVAACSEAGREITDHCAVTIAAWFQSPRGPGETFTRLVSHCPVTVSDLCDAIAYERAQQGYGREADANRLALGMLATWAINRHREPVSVGDVLALLDTNPWDAA